MAKNIGKTDRVIRILIGVVMLLAGFIAHSWWGAIGIVPLVTAFPGFCPLYILLGISTYVNCNVGAKPGKSNARLS